MATITVPFAGDMPDGAQIQVFTVPPSVPFSVPLVPGSTPAPPVVLDTQPVVGSQVTFNNLPAIAPPWSYGFCGFSQGALIWHAAGYGESLSAGFMILDPADLSSLSTIPLSIPAATLATFVPPTPASMGQLTAQTLSVTPGNGTVTIAGTGNAATGFLGISVPVKFSYVFSLSPPGCGAVFPVVVNTVSMEVLGNNGSLLAFQINPFIDIFAGLFSPPSSVLQLAIQGVIDQKVAAAFGQTPKGTTFAVTNITISPAVGIAIQAWASIPMAGNCAGNVASGSVKIRPLEQIKHLRLIRDRLLTRSPEGVGYITTLTRSNPTIMQVLVRHQELLKLGDAFVELVLQDFPQEAPESGKLSERTAAALIDLMDRFAAVAPNDLALTVRGLRTQVRKFVGKTAAEVLNQSWSLLAESPE